MRSARLGTVAVIGATVAAFAITGSPANATAPATSGLQHFLVLNSQRGADAARLFAQGPIHAVGKDVFVDDGTDRFVFPNGDITLKASGKKNHVTVDPKLCLTSVHNTGVYRITGGTRAYAHIRGGGTYVLEAHAYGCDPDLPPVLFSLVVEAHGPVSF